MAANVDEANSVINEVLPDLPVVKTEIPEILNYYDNEFESTPVSIQVDIKPILEEEIDSGTYKARDDVVNYGENEDNKFLKCNKIILGSKPNRVFIDHDNLEQRQTPCQENYVYFPKSSKLNRVSVDENFFEESVAPYEPNVVLHDIKSYLHKSRRFCATCSILFADPQSYESHEETFHAEGDSLLIIAENSYKNKALVEHNQHKCTICDKFFSKDHVLRRHLKNVHRTKHMNPVVKNLNKTYTSNVQHDTSLDSSNTCFHCKKTFETQKKLIDHLYDILQMKRKKTEIVPVLKSILFKCNKCDINFTSSQVAADHAEHMEMLINWKCSICNRIFKKEDELSHERQHSVSNNFLVYNLENIDISNILFKCSKCDTHFDESNFLYHFRDCGLERSKSVYCKICGLLLDYNLKTSHESVEHTNPDRFTIIETHVISDNPMKSTEESFQQRTNLIELLEPVREAKIVLKRIDPSKSNTHSMPDNSEKETNYTVTENFSSNDVEKIIKDNYSRKSFEAAANATKNQKNSKRKTNGNDEMNNSREGKMNGNFNAKRQKLTYLYCETCKCFLTNFRTDVHKQAHCKNMDKIACKLCGLVLSKCAMVTHNRLHEKNKQLKLNHYRFYNLYNGRAIHPPIPDYPQCEDCAVHFVSKIDRNYHICSEEAYLTCHICQMKLSEAAFKLHMAFHQYSMDLVKTSQSSTTSNTENTFETDNAKESSLSLDMHDTPFNDFEDMYEIIYTCGHCSVSVDTYDKVIEHCQDHYKDGEKDTITELCNDCNLKIDITCYANHRNLHEKTNEFKVLKFDSYYLRAENNMWLKHIFKTLPYEKVLSIISNSIYRFECRIKMDVVQKGDPKLTVYKCDQCSCFIEPGALFKHADNSCFKLRQHPCTLCYLPFNSSTSRIEHEKIHSSIPGITLNSYRIVVFNREQDKKINRSFCMRKNYVLYKCRNCNVVIEKLQRYTHECDDLNTKICPDCGLLLHSNDYEKHLEAHQELISFNCSNMKVIILGEAQSNNVNIVNSSKSNFKGAIYDYKMFICRMCTICIKDEKYLSKHSCHFGKQRSKCLKCGLYFSAGSLKTHSKAHDQDPDFLRSNMSIVSFDPCILDQNKNSTLQYTEDNHHSDSNTDSDSDVVMAANDGKKDDSSESISVAKVIEETAKVYKCPCALHFLNEDSIFRHFGVCRSKAKIAKQKCPKCDLLFTPNVLFTHLLAHHSNKSRRYKYDIVEMDNTQKKILQ